MSDCGNEEEQVIRRPNPEGAALQEADRVHLACDPPFLQHQAADWESTQDKEEIYANPAEGLKAQQKRRGNEKIFCTVMKAED